MVDAVEEEPAKKATDHLYWARSESQGAAPPPKPISAEEAKALEANSAGASKWNKVRARRESLPAALNLIKSLPP